MPDSPDTSHAAMVTDHYYMPPEDPNRFLCSHEKEDGHLCNLSVAAHRLGHIDNAESDWDAGRVSRVKDDRTELGKSVTRMKQPPGGNDEDVPGFVRAGEEFQEVNRDEIIKREGHKDDTGKVTHFYLPWVALEEVAKVMEYGAKKYAPGNYQKGMKYSRLWSAALRHLVVWKCGKEKDPETGVSHLAHACCCILMLLENLLMGKGEDDRY